MSTKRLCRFNLAGDIEISLEFKGGDCWVGCYWDVTKWPNHDVINLWICLLPMLPIHVFWARGVSSEEWERRRSWETST